MSTSQTDSTKASINSREGLLANVPALLGFHPTLSLVVLGLSYRGNEVRVTLRYDLPDPAEHELAEQIAQHAVAVLSAQAIETTIAVGYGPGELVTPVADALRARMADNEIQVKEFLRAEGHRYWSYLCQDPACCPPEGTPYEPDADPSVKNLITDRPVLASREALAETLATITGEDSESMHVATRHAEEHAASLIANASGLGGKRTARRRVVTAGLDAVAEAIKTYRDGGQFTSHDEPAWLSLVLKHLRVRDDAWARMDPEHRLAHLRLWTDLTKLARPGYVAPAASLLAFVAWQDGNGALANVALDRALDDNPRYTMAELLRAAIDSGAPPSKAQIPMSPDDVAASYDAQEAEGADDEDDAKSTAEEVTD